MMKTLKSYSGLRAFAESEVGATTADWVVLTAGLVGLGIATIANVSQGVQTTSDGIEDHLNSQIIYSRFASLAEGFSAGAAGWTGVETSEVRGFGDILGPIGGSSGLEVVSKTFDIPEGTEQAVMTFDLLLIDSLDGSDSAGGAVGGNEGPVLYLDGQVIATGVEHSGGDIAWTFEDVPGVTVTSELSTAGTHLGGMNNNSTGNFTDGIHSVTVTVDDPNAALSLGFGLNANQPVQDESIGIDNFNIKTAGLGA